MARITSTQSGYYGTPVNGRNLKQHMANHKKLEIGQILKYDTNGYRRHERNANAAPEQRTASPQSQQVAKPDVKPSQEQSSAPSVANSENKTKLGQQTQQVSTPEIKPTQGQQTQQAAQDVKQSAQSESVTQNHTANSATKPEVKSPAKNSIVLNERGTYDVKLQGQPTRTFSTQADAQKFLDNMTKPKTNIGNIVLNERGTYDVKLQGQPTRTFTTQADAQKFLDNMTNPKTNIGYIVLNERGTYDVKLQGQPTRTFTTQADAQKFLNNISKQSNSNITPKIISEGVSQPVVQSGIKSNLTPIQAGKAPFNKKFWGSGDIKLDNAGDIKYTPQQPVVQLGAKSNLTPIQAGKAPFNKKFWGSGDIKLDNAGNIKYTPQQPVVQLGAKSNLTPILAGKAPFNKKFWGNFDGKLDISKLSYAPQAQNTQSGNVVLGKAKSGLSKFSPKELFKGKNIQKIFKSKGGKFGIAAAAIIAVGAGLYAAATSSSSRGYTKTSIQSPEGYVALLKAYENSHGTNDNSAARLEKIIK